MKLWFRKNTTKTIIVIVLVSLICQLFPPLDPSKIEKADAASGQYYVDISKAAVKKAVRDLWSPNQKDFLTADAKEGMIQQLSNLGYFWEKNRVKKDRMLDQLYIYNYNPMNGYSASRDAVKQWITSHEMAAFIVSKAYILDANNNIIEYKQISASQAAANRETIYDSQVNSIVKWLGWATDAMNNSGRTDCNHGIMNYLNSGCWNDDDLRVLGQNYLGRDMFNYHPEQNSGHRPFSGYGKVTYPDQIYGDPSLADGELKTIASSMEYAFLFVWRWSQFWEYSAQKNGDGFYPSSNGSEIPNCKTNYIIKKDNNEPYNTTWYASSDTTNHNAILNYACWSPSNYKLLYQQIWTDTSRTTGVANSKDPFVVNFAFTNSERLRIIYTTKKLIGYVANGGNDLVHAIDWHLISFKQRMLNVLINVISGVVEFLNMPIVQVALLLISFADLGVLIAKEGFEGAMLISLEAAITALPKTSKAIIMASKAAFLKGVKGVAYGGRMLTDALSITSKYDIYLGSDSIICSDGLLRKLPIYDFHDPTWFGGSEFINLADKKQAKKIVTKAVARVLNNLSGSGFIEKPTKTEVTDLIYNLVLYSNENYPGVAGFASRSGNYVGISDNLIEDIMLRPNDALSLSRLDGTIAHEYTGHTLREGSNPSMLSFGNNPANVFTYTGPAGKTFSATVLYELSADQIQRTYLTMFYPQIEAYTYYDGVLEAKKVTSLIGRYVNAVKEANTTTPTGSFDILSSQEETMMWTDIFRGNGVDPAVALDEYTTPGMYENLMKVYKNPDGSDRAALDVDTFEQYINNLIYNIGE